MDAPQGEQARTRTSARCEPDQDSSESPEPSLAQRRPRREIKPPGEWWKVKPSATPVQDSSSDEEVEAEVKEEEEDSDDELDLLGNTAHSAQEVSRRRGSTWQKGATKQNSTTVSNGLEGTTLNSQQMPYSDS